MPQLPSGFHFALDPTPIGLLIDQVFQSKGVHELMAIETIEDLYGHIEVMFFRPKADAKARDYVESSLPRPEDMEPYPSGFRLRNIHHHLQTHSEADQAAFVEILQGERTRGFLQTQLDDILATKEQLRAQSSTMPGILAAWWRMGCHPLQTPEEYSGTLPTAPSPPKSETDENRR